MKYFFSTESTNCGEMISNNKVNAFVYTFVQPSNRIKDHIEHHEYLGTGINTIQCRNHINCIRILHSLKRTLQFQLKPNRRDEKPSDV